MRTTFFERMGIPDACRVGRRVFKRHFYERIHMNAADKKAFSGDIELITWAYSLKPETVAVAPYEDDLYEYVEIALLQVDLVDKSRVGRLADLIHKAIPYPLVLAFTVGADVAEEEGTQVIAVSVAPKRINQSGADALVVEEIATTPWFAADNLSPTALRFVQSMELAALPKGNLRDLYLGVVDRVRALQWAEQTGSYSVGTTAREREFLRQQMEQHRVLSTELGRLRAAVKRESQFNRKVELNMEIKRLQHEIARLTEPDA